MSKGGPLKSRILDVIISGNECIQYIELYLRLKKNGMDCQKRMSSSHENCILEEKLDKISHFEYDVMPFQISKS